MEFAAYNLLCVIMHSNNNRDLVSSMARLAPRLCVYMTLLFFKILSRTLMYYVYQNFVLLLILLFLPSMLLKFSSLSPLGNRFHKHTLINVLLWTISIFYR